MSERTPGTFTPAVGAKFHPDGRVRRFPGSSLICPLADDAPQRPVLDRLMDGFRRRGFARRFVELPRSRHHMTVFDLVCDQVRQPERWSRRLPLDAPLARVDGALAGWLAAVDPWPAELRMRFADVGPSDVTLHLRLDPATDATRAALATFREAVSAATGIRHPVHDRYRFHISLAYQRIWMDADERRAFEGFVDGAAASLGEAFGELVLGPPRLTLFDDMFAFPEQRPGDGGA